MPDFTFGEAAQWFADSAQEFAADFERAEALTGADLLETAHALSAGPLSTKTLRKLDHPYAKRHGSPRLNPGIINRQSGEFDAAWTLDQPRADGDGLTSALYNTDRKGEWLEKGTKTMVARPVDVLIEERVEPRREARLEVALDRLTS